MKFKPLFTRKGILIVVVLVLLNIWWQLRSLGVYMSFKSIEDMRLTRLELGRFLADLDDRFVCYQKKGRWLMHPNVWAGFGEEGMCVLRAKDAGKKCEDSSECEYGCVSNDGANYRCAEDNVPGRCVHRAVNGQKPTGTLLCPL